MNLLVVSDSSASTCLGCIQTPRHSSDAHVIDRPTLSINVHWQFVAWLIPTSMPCLKKWHFAHCECKRWFYGGACRPGMCHQRNLVWKTNKWMTNVRKCKSDPKSQISKDQRKIQCNVQCTIFNWSQKIGQTQNLVALLMLHLQATIIFVTSCVSLSQWLENDCRNSTMSRGKVKTFQVLMSWLSTLFCSFGLQS